ncbi:hypothetical protein G9A89_010008 [Geosiphon pyriformis]|nr:hypothetical protein G9A89_010008 [Geosiphon pyriformis]
MSHGGSDPKPQSRPRNENTYHERSPNSRNRQSRALEHFPSNSKDRSSKVVAHDQYRSRDGIPSYYNDSQRSSSSYQQLPERGYYPPNTDYYSDPPTPGTVRGSTLPLAAYPPQEQYNDQSYANQYNRGRPSSSEQYGRRGSGHDYNNNTQYTSRKSSYPAPFDIYGDFNNFRREPDDLDERQPTSKLNSPTLPPDTVSDDGNNYPMNLYNTSNTLVDDSAESLSTKPINDQYNPESLEKSKRRKRRCCCCCSRRLCVILTFVILIILGVTIFFVWPRKPTAKILDATPNNKITPVIKLQPAIIKMGFNLRVQIQNTENWVPIRFNKIDVKVYDSNTLSTFTGPIATGNITDYSLPPRTTTIVVFPLTVDYIGIATGDPTIQDFVKACIPQKGGGKANTLNVRADIKLFLWGISWIYKPTISVQISDLVCPYAAIANSILTS